MDLRKKIQRRSGYVKINLLFTRLYIRSNVNEPGDVAGYCFIETNEMC